MFTEPATNTPPINAELLGQSLHGFPGVITFDHVSDIERTMWNGHVYTLETDSGYYIAEGIVVKNCRCALRLVFRDG